MRAAAGWPAAQVVPGGCDYRLPTTGGDFTSQDSPEPQGWDGWIFGHQHVVMHKAFVRENKFLKLQIHQCCVNAS